MFTSSITQKGQVTVPIALRQELGLQPGDLVEFQLADHMVILKKRKNDITAAFGLCKVNKSVSLDDMEKAIEEGPLDDSD